MNIVERILSKVIGQDLDLAELNEVGGGAKDLCSGLDGAYWTTTEERGQLCDYF